MCEYPPGYKLDRHDSPFQIPQKEYIPHFKVLRSNIPHFKSLRRNIHHFKFLQRNIPHFKFLQKNISHFKFLRRNIPHFKFLRRNIPIYSPFQIPQKEYSYLKFLIRNIPSFKFLRRNLAAAWLRYMIWHYKVTGAWYGKWKKSWNWKFSTLLYGKHGSKGKTVLTEKKETHSSNQELYIYPNMLSILIFNYNTFSFCIIFIYIIAWGTEKNTDNYTRPFDVCKIPLFSLESIAEKWPWLTVLYF